MPTDLYLGLMSGTSIDGIDAGIFELAKNHTKLIAAKGFPFDDDLKQKILQLSKPGMNEIDRLGELDIELAQAFAHGANALLSQAGISASEITGIGSHGQTVRHRPDASFPFTLQIGDPNTIAQITGITTVGDLRRRDMAAGGHGAPLAPAFHRAAFYSPNQARGIVNIGGMANISVLTEVPEDTVGCDTGPGNVLMDAWIQDQQQLVYDRDGAWAASGKIKSSLLGRLLQHPFLKKVGPKSTGREDFNFAWLQTLLSDELRSDGEAISSQDVQATLCEFTAVSIARATQEHSIETIYICGGGARNLYLKRRLSELLAPTPVATTDDLGIPPEWVEVGLCAWIAKQTLLHQTGSIPGVTGARAPSILGGIFVA